MNEQTKAYRAERLRAAVRHARWAIACERQAAADAGRGDLDSAERMLRLSDAARADRDVEIAEAQAAHDEIVLGAA